MPLRTTGTIDRGWWFARGPADRTAWAPTGPDDADGHAPVAVPHTTAVVPLEGFDEAVLAGVSTYRRRLRLPADGTGGRVVVRFDAVMTAATVWCNGSLVAEHLGGFVPFDVELTDVVRRDGEDVLVVEVDSSERPDAPPFGGHLDYLTYGGIYRDVTLSVLPAVFVADVFAMPVDVLGDDRRVEVEVTLDAGRGAPSGAHAVAVSVAGGPEVTVEVPPDAWHAGRAVVRVVVRGLDHLALWDVDTPVLHDVTVRLLRDGGPVDATAVRTGLREARFTPDGFLLNGRRITLRGLNRHQTYPHLGAAMPARQQRRDAEVLKEQLHLDAVRTSHYPQSPHFLDACDELGLLVFEEMPGWQHVGDAGWQDLAVRDVEAMVRRDRNRPSLVLWGVRVNESMDHHDLYERTNAAARALDPSRQTSGVRYFRDSELLEDVFALNDFETGGWLHPPTGPLYLVSEYAGHMFPTKRYDNTERVQEHAVLHLTVLENVAAEPGIAGGFGWCAFDYATHAEFGSGDRVCHHGVSDAFRVPKAAAAVYRSQCPPEREVVLEPAFTWAAGDHSDYGGPGLGLVLSNCDRVVAFVDGVEAADLAPARERFGHLAHPPFLFGQTSGIAPWRRTWGALRLDGYVDGELVASRTWAGDGVAADVVVEVDDTSLVADGTDTTRLVVRVVDRYGNTRRYTVAAVDVRVDGPLDVVGDLPLALPGGVGAVWLRARQEPGRATVTVRHPRFGERTVQVDLTPAAEEQW